jgi:hypothetical protein
VRSHRADDRARPADGTNPPEFCTLVMVEERFGVTIWPTRAELDGV